MPPSRVQPGTPGLPGDPRCSPRPPGMHSVPGSPVRRSPAAPTPQCGPPSGDPAPASAGAPAATGTPRLVVAIEALQMKPYWRPRELLRFQPEIVDFRPDSHTRRSRRGAGSNFGESKIRINMENDRIQKRTRKCESSVLKAIPWDKPRIQIWDTMLHPPFGDSCGPFLEFCGPLFCSGPPHHSA